MPNDIVHSLMARYRSLRDDSDVGLKSVPLSQFVLTALAQRCQPKAAAFQLHCCISYTNGIVVGWL
jgi:hypothetical protein